MFHLLSKQRNKMSALPSTKVTATITTFFPKIIFGFHSYCFGNWVPRSLGHTNHYCDCGLVKSHVSVSFGLHESKSPITFLFFLFWTLSSCSQKCLQKHYFNLHLYTLQPLFLLEIYTLIPSSWKDAALLLLASQNNGINSNHVCWCSPNSY